MQDLRYFLSMGMLCSGLFTFLFGLALTAKIKSLAYFIVIQVIEGENRRSEDCIVFLYLIFINGLLKSI